MAITDPRAARFCNDRIRSGANRFVQLYYWAKIVAEEWTSQDMAVRIPDIDDEVDDNSASDGRPGITGEAVHQVKDRFVELIAFLEANNNEKLDQLVAVATHPQIGGID